MSSIGSAYCLLKRLGKNHKQNREYLLRARAQPLHYPLPIKSVLPWFYPHVAPQTRPSKSLDLKEGLGPRRGECRVGL